MYDEGTLVNSKAVTTDSDAPTTVMEVGTRGSERDKLEGVIAEIILFKSALTADEAIGLEHLIGDFYDINVPTATAPQIAAAQALFPAGSKYGVPEPSTLALALMAALGGLAVLWRRRKT